MDTYIKTIINGLKAWVTNCLTRMESSVSGSLHSMADKLTRLSTKVQKNTTDIAQLQAYEDETNALANQAQTTAQSAQTTATQAQTTATQAQTTAAHAQSTATQAVASALWGSPNTEAMSLTLTSDMGGKELDDLLGYHLICGEKYTYPGIYGQDTFTWGGTGCTMAVAQGAGLDVRFKKGKYNIAFRSVAQATITGKFAKTPKQTDARSASQTPYMVARSLLMWSNDGTRLYRVTVTNEGSLTTTEVAE